MWNKTDSKTFFFCYVCSDRKLTQKLYYPPWTETLTATTHGIFILKDLLRFDCPPISQACWMRFCVERISLGWCQPDLFFLSALEFGQRSAQPEPPGALANLSSPSVFHVAWGTLAGSPNELARPPSLPPPPPPPPAIACCPCATCLGW